MIVAGSPTRVVQIFFPQIERKSGMLQESLEEQAEQLLKRLQNIT